MNVDDVAEEGLKKLKSGSPGISLSALNKDDLQYFLNYYNLKGFDAKEEKAISREGVGTIYPITIFHKMPSEVNENA